MFLAALTFVSSSFVLLMLSLREIEQSPPKVPWFNCALGLQDFSVVQSLLPSLGYNVAQAAGDLVTQKTKQKKKVLFALLIGVSQKNCSMNFGFRLG